MPCIVARGPEKEPCERTGDSRMPQGYGGTRGGSRRGEVFMPGHASGAVRRDALRLDDGLNALAERFGGDESPFRKDGALPIDVGVVTGTIKGGVSVVAPSSVITKRHDLGEIYKLTEKQRRLLDGVLSPSVLWRRARFPEMTENYVASGFISGGQVPGTTGEIATSWAGNGAVSAVSVPAAGDPVQAETGMPLVDEGSYRPGEMKWWIRNWQCRRKLSEVPKGCTKLRIRMSVDAEINHPYSSAAATQYSAFATLSLSRAGEPPQSLPPSAFPVFVDSPTGFPSEGGYVDLVCEVGVAPREKPELQLILGVIVGVRNGHALLIIGGTHVAVHRQGMHDPASMGWFEYQYV